jgi:hypothetical protein
VHALPSPKSKDFAIGSMPDIPDVPAVAQEATKQVVKCFALAVSEHSAELKSTVPDSIQTNAATIFAAIPGKSESEMTTIRKSLATIADLLNSGSPVERLPNVMGVPGLDDAGNKALLKMLKHIHDQSSKETAFPEGKMKSGLFGHFPIKVSVPAKPQGAADAMNPPAAAGAIQPLPLDRPSVEVLKMDAYVENYDVAAMMLPHSTRLTGLSFLIYRKSHHSHQKSHTPMKPPTKPPTKKHLAK